MTDTKIEWATKSWNPVRGCSRVSEGCRHCYAERQAHRFSSGPGQPYEGLTRDGRWTGEVRCVPDKLAEPLRWQGPQRIFVNSMSDLFHPEVPDSFVDRVFAVMALCPQHTFQVLTKRPERMREYMARFYARVTQEGERFIARGTGAIQRFVQQDMECGHFDGVTLRQGFWSDTYVGGNRGSLPNVWLGTSVENQAAADERIPHLLQTPASVRFLSCEPLLGPVDIMGWALVPVMDRDAFGPSFDWVIAGGESGPGARPCNVEWIRDIVRQCFEAEVLVFVKQLGAKPTGWCLGRAWGDEPESDYEPDHCDAYEASEAPPCSGRCMYIRSRKGADPSEWPGDLRVREWPEGDNEEAR